jgi:hypothetical protein
MFISNDNNVTYNDIVSACVYTVCEKGVIWMIYPNPCLFHYLLWEYQFRIMPL